VSHGVLVLLGDGTFTYTPNQDFNGNDSFSYTVNDLEPLVSNEVTVNITVNPINDAPVGAPDAFTAIEDVELSVDVASGVLDNDDDVDLQSQSV
jgi:large repetitive protein